jgi:hypothetical protein
MRRGAPLCAVHEPLGEPYVLLDGRKVPVDLGIPIVAVDDMALEPLADNDREAAI